MQHNTTMTADPMLVTVYLGDFDHIRFIQSEDPCSALEEVGRDDAVVVEEGFVGQKREDGSIYYSPFTASRYLADCDVISSYSADTEREALEAAFRHIQQRRAAERGEDWRKVGKGDFPVAPIATPRYKVIYLVNGKEKESAWLYRKEHAQRGLEMMQAKYGKKNAIIYVD